MRNINKIVLSVFCVLPSALLCAATTTDTQKTKQTMAPAKVALSTPKVAPATSDIFEIKKIIIKGLVRISKGTVYSYLPVKAGDEFNPHDSDDIIRALYKTNFFSDISLTREGDALVITVVERPVIGEVKISGNSDITTDKLTEALKRVGLQDGLVFNQSLINDVKQSLQEEYYSRGKYNARVDVTVKSESRNRVSVNILISEGVEATIKHINIVGAQVFTSSELLDQLTITTPGWFTWMTGNDKYSRAKLEASLEALRSYYMDRGYIEFNISSVQVALTPDRKSVYVVINVSEGPQFKFSGYALKGQFILPEKTLQDLVHIKKGDIFSRKTVIESDKGIIDALGNKGYAFANVDATPDIDKKNRTVFLNLTVEPGHLTYVDQIHFVGNDAANDSVLRQALRQMEGGLFNTDNIEQSKWHLQQLPYISDVQVETIPVAGKKDEVDVDYKVKEKSSANFMASIGYSQLDGFIFSTGIVEHDLLGTGKTLGFNFTRSRGYESYNINYVNPYYTIDGISRSVNLYLTHLDPGDLNLTNGYSVSNAGFDVTYSIPVSESKGSEDDVSLGYGLQNTLLTAGSTPPTVVSDFINDFTSHPQVANLNAGFTHNGFDKIVFPTKGVTQSIGTTVTVPANNNTPGYYTTSYNINNYLPLSINHHFILNAKGTAEFGSGYMRSGRLPFYQNFYVGGMNSVRGYEGNTLGPVDSNDEPLGGNLGVYGTLALIFPNPISPNSLRTSWFIDAGNAFTTYDSPDKKSLKLNNLRYATGIEFDWLTPIGLINFSLAKAINPHSGDSTEPFQFSMGTSF